MTEGKELDFRQTYWGHMLSVSEHKRDWRRREIIKGCGWSTPRPAIGDILIMSLTDGGVASFGVTKVEYVRDPQDMFFFTAVLLSATEPSKADGS